MTRRASRLVRAVANESVIRAFVLLLCILIDAFCSPLHSPTPIPPHRATTLYFVINRRLVRLLKGTRALFTSAFREPAVNPELYVAPTCGSSMSVIFPPLSIRLWPPVHRRSFSPYSSRFLFLRRLAFYESPTLLATVAIAFHIT
jgi:hypothetical protein